MTITQDQIEKISTKLAKLPKAKEKLAHDLQSILWYVDMLNELDTTWIIPTVSVSKKKSVLREDVESSDKIDPMELLKCSSWKIIANQIAVWNIMH